MEKKKKSTTIQHETIAKRDGNEENRFLAQITTHVIMARIILQVEK